MLRSQERNTEKRALLSQKYNDIFLVFDFEPHHDNPHFDTVRRMLKYFNCSSERGKLYLNYPMIQSYKHIMRLPDRMFSYKTINIEDVYKYKEIVGKESSFQDLSKYTYATFVSLAVHHIKKANYLITGEDILPPVEIYLDMNSLDIFDEEYSLLMKQRVVSILNTSLFIFVDFKPRAFFREITSNNARFDI